jgi:hypothetical protein
MPEKVVDLVLSINPEVSSADRASTADAGTAIKDDEKRASDDEKSLVEASYTSVVSMPLAAVGDCQKPDIDEECSSAVYLGLGDKSKGPRTISFGLLSADEV